MGLDWVSCILFLITTCILLFILLCVFLLQSDRIYPVISRSDREKEFYDPRNGRRLAFPSLDEPWNVSLSVIVPAYEEEVRLPPMLDECLEYLEQRTKDDRDFTYEVIIVSDGSKDRTVDIGHKYSTEYGSEKVRVLDLKPNRGKGGAVKLGMLSARGALLLFADADGATKFSELTKLEDNMAKLTGCDYRSHAERASSCLGIVCGSRAHLEKDAIAARSLFRTFLMHGFHFLVWSLAVKTIRDTQCGFKLLTREAASLCFSSLHVQRWAFDVELLYIAETLNIPISEVCVNWTEVDGSKVVPVWSWLQMGRDLFLIWLRYKIGAWKIQEKRT